MWTNAAVMLGSGEHSRGSHKVFDAGFSFFGGLRRHNDVKDLPLPQWFSLSLKVCDGAGAHEIFQ